MTRSHADERAQRLAAARDHVRLVERIAHPDNPLGQATRTATERDALIHLHAAAPGSVTLGELARSIGLSRAAMTALADRLTTAHLIRRVPDTSDRRRTFIELTKEGAHRVRIGLTFNPKARA